MDVSDALQAAINHEERKEFLNPFYPPQGKYKISKTIYIPTVVCLIGYGELPGIYSG